MGSYVQRGVGSSSGGHEQSTWVTPCIEDMTHTYRGGSEDGPCLEGSVAHGAPISKAGSAPPTVGG